MSLLVVTDNQDDVPALPRPQHPPAAPCREALSDRSILHAYASAAAEVFRSVVKR